MRLRRQKEVQKENEYYYEFLREALPPGTVREEAFNFNPQPSPKPSKFDRTTAGLGFSSLKSDMTHFNPCFQLFACRRYVSQVSNGDVTTLMCYDMSKLLSYVVSWKLKQ